MTQRGTAIGLVLALLLGVAVYLACRMFEDPLLVLVVAYLPSLVVPRRHIWIVLAAWAVLLLLWSALEFSQWLSGDTKFGPMAILYSAGGIVLGLAAWLAIANPRSTTAHLHLRHRR